VEIGSQRLIPIGLAAVSDGAGGSDFRASVVAVTPGDLVLLDADAAADPVWRTCTHRPVGDNGRSHRRRARRSGRRGPIRRRELGEPPDRRYVSGSRLEAGFRLFTFRALSRALEARDAIVEHALARPRPTGEPAGEDPDGRPFASQ